MMEFMYARAELLHITQNADNLIETAGRTCYKSENKITAESTAKFVGKILKNKHLSVIEHASATVKVSNISRACSHQLVRHRLASYSQQSQRYVSEENFGYILPPDIAIRGGAFAQAYSDTMRALSLDYKYLRSTGIKKEDCRYLLPNATTTEIVMTMNFRNWLHFFEERLATPAQWEIKTMACCIYGILQRYSQCFNQLHELNHQALLEIKPIRTFIENGVESYARLGIE